MPFRSNFHLISFSCDHHNLSRLIMYACTGVDKYNNDLSHLRRHSIKKPRINWKKWISVGFRFWAYLWITNKVTIFFDVLLLFQRLKFNHTGMWPQKPYHNTWELFEDTEQCFLKCRNLSEVKKFVKCLKFFGEWCEHC